MRSNYKNSVMCKKAVHFSLFFCFHTQCNDKAILFKFDQLHTPMIFLSVFYQATSFILQEGTKVCLWLKSVTINMSWYQQILLLLYLTNMRQSWGSLGWYICTLWVFCVHNVSWRCHDIDCHDSANLEWCHYRGCQSNLYFFGNIVLASPMTVKFSITRTHTNLQFSPSL